MKVFQLIVNAPGYGVSGGRPHGPASFRGHPASVLRPQSSVLSPRCALGCEGPSPSGWMTSAGTRPLQMLGSGGFCDRNHNLCSPPVPNLQKPTAFEPGLHRSNTSCSGHVFVFHVDSASVIFLHKTRSRHLDRAGWRNDGTRCGADLQASLLPPDMHAEPPPAHRVPATATSRRRGSESALQHVPPVGPGGLVPQLHRFSDVERSDVVGKLARPAARPRE